VRAVVVKTAVMGHVKCGNEPAGSAHLRGISCLAEELWASQEGLRPLELVCQLILAVKFQQGARGGAVGRGTAPKPEGRGFDSRWCHWNLSLSQSFRPHYDSGVDLACNRYE